MRYHVQKSNHNDECLEVKQLTTTLSLIYYKLHEVYIYIYIYIMYIHCSIHYRIGRMPHCITLYEYTLYEYTVLYAVNIIHYTLYTTKLYS